MKLSKRKQAVEARRASDPVAQFMEREDIDYENPDELPTAPRDDPRSFRCYKGPQMLTDIFPDGIEASIRGDEVTIHTKPTPERGDQ